jgi:hypothetical protein
MKRTRFLAEACFLALLSVLLLFGSTEAAFASNPVTLGFDDLANPPPGGMPIRVPYGGLQWNNFNYVNGLTYTFPNGYSNAVVSAPNVVYNGGAEPASLSGGIFDLDSAYLTGAWNDFLQVEVKGFFGTILVYDNTYTVDSTAPTLINFNYFGISSAEFSSSGGVPHGYIGGTGEQFAMDNLTITFVPEPSTLALAGLGAAALIVFRRRR